MIEHVISLPKFRADNLESILSPITTQYRILTHYRYIAVENILTMFSKAIYL